MKPTATYRPLPNVTLSSPLVVGELCAIQSVPFAEVTIVPLMPTATYKPSPCVMCFSQFFVALL